MHEMCPIKQLIEGKVSCEKALERLSKKGVRGEKLDHERCPWHIDSPHYKYCFWIYISDPKNHKERQLTEIAKLLKTSVNNIKLIEMGALEKISDKLIHLKN